MEKTKQTKIIKKMPKVFMRAKSGSVSATVFMQQVTGKYGENTMYNISLQNSYKDKNDEWQYGHTFSSNDLIKIYVVLDAIRNKILLKDTEKEKEEDEETTDIEED